jgi:hypothetical protein
MNFRQIKRTIYFRLQNDIFILKEYPKIAFYFYLYQIVAYLSQYWQPRAAQPAPPSARKGARAFPKQRS